MLKYLDGFYTYVEFNE